MKRPCCLILALLLVPMLSARATEPPSETWLADAQREVAQREYHASVNSVGLQAPNRANGFRTYFNTHGLHLVDRSASIEASAQPMAGVRLLEVGRHGRRQSLAEATLSADKGQVLYKWPDIEAIYDNRADGLSQELHVLRRPVGDGAVDVVFLIEDAKPTLEANAVALHGKGGIFRLQEFSGTDATGLDLQVQTVIEDQLLVVRVDDPGATYPIVIKTLIVPGLNAVLQMNQADAAFGFSVAGAGDLNGDGYADVIVGAATYDWGAMNTGAAFVFLGGAGLFNTNVYAALGGAQAGELLGSSVAGVGDVDGDGYSDVAVGSPNWNNGTANAAGAVSVYLGNSSGIDTKAAVRLEFAQFNARFGYRVASAGDVNGDGFSDIIVGAPYFDTTLSDEGAAFIYFGGSDGPDTAADAELRIGQANANFGWSVGGGGDINGDGYADALVGARNFDNGQHNEGAVFVYLGGSGNFDTTADAQLESNRSSAGLGWSVAGNGDVNGDGFADVVAGAFNYSNGENLEGALYIFFGGAGNINTTADAVLESNMATAGLGASVASGADINGDGYADVVAGAPQLDNGQNNEGGLWIYSGGPGAFDTDADMILEGNVADVKFGSSVALAGDVNGDGFADVLVGAPQFELGQANEGLAFLYYGRASDMGSTPAVLLESNQANALAGTSVAGAGDLNGDGYSDLVVGALGYDAGQINEGAAFIYFGREGNLSTTPDAQVESNQPGSDFARSVAAAGDLNGDGFGDLVVGASTYLNEQNEFGAAFVYFGGTGGFDATADARLDGDSSLSLFGVSVAGAGDLNGDGYADLAVGAPYFSGGQFEEGATFIYFGGPGNFGTTPDVSLFAGQAGGAFGGSVDGAGDVNGDGFADLIVGAPYYDGATIEQGAAYLYYGGSGTFDQINDAFFTYGEVGARFGSSVAGAGDINGDGYADLIVGAPYYDYGGQDDEGVAFIYFGGSGAFNTNEDAILQRNQVAASFGASVASAGDINGDGYGDVIVGAPLWDGGEIDEGAGFIYLGGPGAFNVVADNRFESQQAGARLGGSVAGAGDLDGDGFADLVVGSLVFDNGQYAEGAAFIYYGSAIARPVMASQFRGDANTAVAPWGHSNLDEGFVVSMQATSPRGRERAKLQVEACRSGAAFGSPLCEVHTAANWVELGATPQSTTLALSIGGLSTQQLYHWRARVLYAPFSVTAPGVSSPPNPIAGPWRRLQANAETNDIRTGRDTNVIFINGFD